MEQGMVFPSSPPPVQGQASPAPEKQRERESRSSRCPQVAGAAVHRPRGSSGILQEREERSVGEFACHPTPPAPFHHHPPRLCTKLVPYKLV